MPLQVVKLLGDPVSLNISGNVFNDGEGDPSGVGNSTSDGTSEYSARRDHSHALNISGLTADASPDSAADYVVTYDASAGTNKKVLLDDLPASSGISESLAIAYATAL